MYTFIYLKGYMVIVVQFVTYLITSILTTIIYPKGCMIAFCLRVLFAVQVNLAVPDTRRLVNSCHGDSSEYRRNGAIQLLVGTYREGTD